MALRKHYGLACLALIGAITPTACGDDAGKAPEGPGNGGSGGDRGGSSNNGGSSNRGGDSGSSQGGDSGSAGEGTSKGGEGGEPGGGGTAGSSKGGKGGSSTGGSGAAPTSTCEDPWSEPNTSTACDIDGLPMNTTTMLTGDISSNVTLTSGNAYRLSGPTRVLDGATLTIPPCVRIEGQGPTSVLAVLPGGTIMAEGEEDRPIVFTSAEPVGQRGPGDWGGIIILGNARVNSATSTSRPGIEGLVATEEYGWHTNEFNSESSGTLAYVRVEYTGQDLGNNNETNGLTFGGVGSGTVVHHVMSSNSLDDCFEWFGGTVNADHLIALNCDDDMFDTDAGFNGTVQFAFGRAYPTTQESDPSGFEMDSNGVPLTEARWSNVTLCGNDSRNDLRVGMLLKNGVGGDLSNTIVTGFHGGAFKVINASTVSLTASAAFRNDEIVAVGHEVGGPNWFFDQDGNSDEAPEGFCDCWADPPNPFPLAPIPGIDPPSGAVDSNASYVGAFEDGQPANNWMTGKWVDWAEN